MHHRRPLVGALGMACVSLVMGASLWASNERSPSYPPPQAPAPSGLTPDSQPSPGQQISYDQTAASETMSPCPHCLCQVCDCGPAATAKLAASAYQPLFFDNDFSYVCDPCYEGWHPGESLKRVGLGSHLVVDVGGQYRARLHNERNHRGLGLTGVDDDFLLHRTRLFMNAEFGRRVRLYAEYIDAESNYENAPSRPIEVNRSDMQNLFLDLMLFDGRQGPVWARAGRQELQYGSQRLVSPLDWANTRRTFEGYKVFWHGTDWALDGFYTRPVAPRATQFDRPDYDREFMGLWGTYSASPQRTLDVYYLGFNNGDVGFAYDTLGSRLSGSHADWSWEWEGGIQFGQNDDGSDHSAGFWTAGLGRKFSGLPWKPALWAFYDWASGSNDRGAGHGFHHLFPLAHKYLGFMDLYGRQNLETPNVRLALQPHDKIQLLVWYHYFMLQNNRDTPYSVVMTPYNPDHAPASGDLGHEIDLTVTYKLSSRAELLFGYSHFFAGDYYKLTPGVLYRDDADFFYTHFQVNF